MNSKIEKYAAPAAFASVLMLALSISLAQIDDFDVWWHLKCGELVVTQGWIARVDIFSLTAQGRPWINGYMLAQVVMNAFEGVGGAAGVSIFGALMVALIYAVAFGVGAKWRSSHMALVLAAIPAVMLARPTFLPRPALFTPLFSLIAIWLLDDYTKRGGRGIYALLPLSMIWANSHPAFPLLMMFTAIYAAANAVKPVRERRDSIILAALVVGEMLAALLNPYGPGIYYSIKEFAAGGVLKDIILEWRPLFAIPKTAWGVREFFVATCGIWLVTAIISRKRANLPNIALFVAMFAMTLASRRNLLLFGAMSIPLIGWNMRNDDGVAGNNKLRSGIALLIIFTALLGSGLFVSNRFYAMTGEMYRAGVGVNRSIFPVAEAELLSSENIKGNILHPYAIGGFLIHELHPKYKVFVDGRVFPYPLDLFMQAETAFSDWRTFESLRKEWDIRAVIIPITIENRWPFLMALMQNPNWACVAADSAAALFLLRGAGNDEVIARREIKPLEKPIVISDDNGAWGFVAKYPSGEMRWAKIYSRMGHPDLALPLIERAFAISPNIEGLEKWYGLTQIDMGRWSEGCSHIDNVIVDPNDDVGAYIGAAKCGIYRGKLPDAERFLTTAVELDPKQGAVWNMLGEMALDKKLYRDAEEKFSRAVAIEPDNPMYLENLGTALMPINSSEAAKALMKARDIYRSIGAPQSDIDRVSRKLDALR